MATTKNTAVFDKMEARLASISTANEYTNTARTIDRSRVVPFKGEDLPGINIWPSLITNSVDQYGQDTRKISIVVEGHTKTRNEPFTDTCDKFAADIITALNRAVASPLVSDTVSLDLGGTVDSFTFTQYTYQVGDGEQPICGIILICEAEFTAELNDMLI